MDKIDAELIILNAKEAENLLNNPVWISIKEKMYEGLQKERMQCSTSSEAGMRKAADLIRCERLLNGIYRKIQQIAETKKLGEIKLVDIEKEKQARERKKTIQR